MYATGVGLVMKGIEKYEREAKRGTNTAKIIEEPKSKVTQQQTLKNSPITGHSTKKTGSFFDSLISKAKDWISDDVD